MLIRLAAPPAFGFGELNLSTASRRLAASDKANAISRSLVSGGAPVR